MMLPPYENHTEANYFLPYQIMFVSLHLLSRAKAVSKKSIAKKSRYRNSANFNEGGQSILLSLEVYAISISIPTGVRYVP